MQPAAGSTDDGSRRARRGRRAIALTLGVAGALAAVAVAYAQEPVPLGSYGGGTIVDPGKSPSGAGNMIISLRATGDGRVRVLAKMGARCATATIQVSATLMSDGSFSVSGAARERPGDGERVRTTYKIAGTISGANASGMASARSTVRRRGRPTRRCKTGSVQWGARRPTGDIGAPGAAQPTARLYGTTSQRVAGRRPGIVLRISADAKRVTRALYSVNLRCPGESLFGIDGPAEKLSIGADGKLSDVERSSLRLDRRTRIRTTERFNATVGSAGAIGSLNLSARIIDIPSGRTLARCRTGTVRFTAAL